MGLLMKTTLGLMLVLSGLVTACSRDTVAPPPKAPIGALTPVTAAGPGVDTVTSKEHALAGLYIGSLSSPPAGGAPFAQLGPLLNPDLAGFSSPGMPPAHEPAAIVAAHEKLFGAFDDRKMTLTRIWRTPSAQTLEWTMTGTHARTWKDIPPTHKPVIIKGVTLLWTKDDGTIIDVHVYFDVAAVKAGLGVAPKGLDVASLPVVPPPTGGTQELEQALPPAGEENKNVELAKGALDALEANKEADYLGAMADDVEVDTSERVAHGKAEAKAYFRAMRKAIGQLDTTVIASWGVSTYAVVEYSIAGEQLGPIMWIPAERDRVVRWELVDIYEIKNGKIAHVWRYDNPIQILD
jgi:predicted ester cyclase